MNHSKLFSPHKIGNIEVKNRFLMAPMTRSRATQPGDVPNALMAEYYAQRASAGIIITEATQVSLQGMGYAKTPGIYSQDQIENWKLTTEAVHKAESTIFLQLWHVGRVSSSKVNGLQPIAPSPLIAKDTNVYVFDGAPNGDATFVPVEEPKEMTKTDIDTVIQEFAQGAKNSIEAGFDGVEIHGANGYLIDQFLRSNSNHRTDEYGGSQENRIRLLIEITKAVVEVVGAEKNGVRLSPFITFKDMDDAEILETMMLACKELQQLNIAYIHLAAALSNLKRDTIKYNDISEDDLKAFLKKIGFPDFAIYLHSGTIRDIKMAQYEIESHTMETLLGRPTASIEDIMEELFQN